jgi:phenylalanine-4-hydroxylase
LEEENYVWQRLMLNQLPLVGFSACKEYISGLRSLDLPISYVPSVGEINKKLAITGWEIFPTDKMLSPFDFFESLRKKQFPAIQRLRPFNEVDYYTNSDPDIFHEYFGHCPFLMNNKTAEIIHMIAKKACSDEEGQLLKMRDLFWAVFEFGLVGSTPQSTKISGAGILASRHEIFRVLTIRESLIQKLPAPEKIYASLKGNISQPLYYYVQSLDSLEKLFVA